ncbi:MAG: hypothetical protein RMM29_01060 [Planctomycetota bacterium]|nr:hypothetical protein [Planctomycetota bacterium]MCX8040399.1 hypothetical protein [Planctomycetota bacterium]MDW8372225.1 hypothetical protein [Planctomycetota bacterium]
MSLEHRIIVPGTEHPASIPKVLESLAKQQRVATVIVRRGERFLLKIMEVRKEVLVGEVRCLNWSPEMTRKIYELAKDGAEWSERRRELLLADAIDRFGGEAHRFRVYIALDEITAVYEDLEDRFDQTPYLPLP